MPPLFFHQIRPYRANKKYCQHQALHFIITLHRPRLFKSGCKITFNKFTVKNISFLSCIYNHKELKVLLCDSFINNVMWSFILKWCYLNQWIGLMEKLSTSVSTFTVSMKFYSPPFPHSIMFTLCNCNLHPIILSNCYCWCSCWVKKMSPFRISDIHTSYEVWFSYRAANAKNT